MYTKKGEIIFVGLLMLTASIMSGFLVISNPNLGVDGAHYLLPMHNLVAGKGYTYGGEPQTFWSPGYGIISFPIFLLVRDVELSGMVASALAYVFVIPLVFYLAKMIFGRTHAFFATFLVAFFPALIGASFLTLSEATYTFFLVLSLFIYLRILLQGYTWQRSISIGFLFGLLYLIRPEAFILGAAALGMLGLYLGIDAWRLRNRGTEALNKRALLGLCMASIIFVTVAGSYILFLYKHTGEWMLSPRGKVVLVQYGERVTEGNKFMGYEDSLQSYTNLFDYIRSKGGRFLLRLQINGVKEVSYLVRNTLPALIPLLVLWFVYPFVSSRRLFAPPFFKRENLYIASAFLVFMIPVPAFLLFYIADRFLVPYSVLLLILFAGLTVRFLMCIIERAPNGRRLAGGMALVMTLSSFVVSDYMPLAGQLPFPYTTSIQKVLAQKQGHRGLRAAGLWFRKNVPDIFEHTVAVIDYNGVFDFYLQGKQEPVGSRNVAISSNVTKEEFVVLLGTNAFDYLVLDVNYSKKAVALREFWDNPENMETYQWTVVHDDANGLFKIYQKSKNEDEEPIKKSP